MRLFLKFNFGIKLYMFQTVPLSIIRSFSLYTQQLYVIQVCWQLASRIRTEGVPSWSCSQAVSKPVWHIPLLCVQWKAPDDGQRNCPKHVEFYSKNKFEKLLHLVGFIIRRENLFAPALIQIIHYPAYGIVCMIPLQAHCGPDSG